MYYYFAQFYPQEENPGGYSVIFPDLPGCNTCGDDLDEAMSMAMDALTGYLEVARDRGEEIPEPSDFKTARARGEAYYAELGIPPNNETLYLLVPADPKQDPFIRLNISMKPRLLSQIDRKAKEAGMTRSGLLAAAAREYIQNMDAANLRAEIKI